MRRTATHPTDSRRAHWNFSLERNLRGVFVVEMALLAGCGTMHLTSQWGEDGITIDGVNSEWQGSMVETNVPEVSVGVRNNRDFLYVCLTTSNRPIQMQMIILGCTVWFDPRGSNERTLGIHFPVGGMLQPGQRFPTRDNPEVFRQALEVTQRVFEILGPEEDQRQRFRDREVRGVDVHAGYEEGILTYELKMPLRRTVEQPFGISPDAISMLSIGFETGEITADARSRPTASGRAMTPPPRGGGRPSASRRSSVPGGEGDQLEPLKLWATVQLPGSTPPMTE